MKEFFKTGRFKALLAVVFILLGFMLYAVSTGGFSDIPSSVVGAITTPLQSISASISDGADRFLSRFVNFSDQTGKIEDLEEQLRVLREQQVDYDTAIRENEELRKYLELKEQNPEYKFAYVQVSARDPGEFYYSFTINAGSLQGISPGDPVITDDGLVGYVDEVQKTFSHVKTLLHNDLEVGAIDSQTQEVGVVGKNSIPYAREGLCRLIYLDRFTNVNPGDLIITSGVGGRYPRGIIVGTVQELLTESDGISRYAVIKPAADIREVRDAMVVLDFYGKGVETPAGSSSSAPDESAASGSASSGSSVSGGSSSSLGGVAP